MDTSDFSRFEYLVKTNLFLSPDKKQNLLSQFSLLPTKNQKEALVVMEKAEQDQQSVLRYALAKNPNIVAEVKHNIAHTRQEQLHKKERLSKSQEQVSLDQLESDLDDIFNN